MGTLQIKKNPKKYDAIIIGSGAGGGMATYVLAKAGLKVCLIEAGPMYDPAKNSNQMQPPWASPRRGRSTKFRPFGDFDGCYWGWDIDGEPYTHVGDTKWEWWRARMLGGRTNHWGRITLRFGPKDFKKKDIDGLGDNWPISYDDVKPYYDKVESLIGVFGTNEGLPNDPDGIFLPPPKPRLHEMLIKKTGTSLNIPVIPSRLSILTKKINDERGQCFYCAQCGRSCKVYADFSSSSVLIIPALKTGNVDLLTNCMAREVLTDKEGLATGVSYVNKADMEEYVVEGKTVLLAASTCESARLLLNSRSQCIKTAWQIQAMWLENTCMILPALIWVVTYQICLAENVIMKMALAVCMCIHHGGLIIKNWIFPVVIILNTAEVWTNLHMALDGIFKPSTVNRLLQEKKEAGGYGKSLKEDYRFFYGASVGMAGRGEALALESNYCEIDPNTVDKYGIPVLRFNTKYTDYEIKQAKHMKETFKEILTTMGAVITFGDDGPETNYGLHNPGNIIHEAGTVRMGSDAKKSALNAWSQAHDAKNVFCVDGGPFVSQGDKNITHTILALSWRTSDYIVDQMKKQNI